MENSLPYLIWRAISASDPSVWCSRWRRGETGAREVALGDPPTTCRTSNPRTPPATQPAALLEAPCTLRSRSSPGVAGQAAAWKRTRAWAARASTRSGPSTAGRARSILGSCRAATTGTLPRDHLAPGNLSAVDGHDRHHHHIRVGQDLGGSVSLEVHRAQRGGERIAPVPAARTGRAGGGRGTAWSRPRTPHQDRSPSGRCWPGCRGRLGRARPPTRVGPAARAAGRCVAPPPPRAARRPHLG